MMQWSTNRVNPAVAARTAMPGMSRQSNAAAPIGSREQFRSRDMPQRNAPAQRGAAKKAADDDDEDDKKPDDREPLFSRDEDKDDDGLDDGKPSGRDPENDDVDGDPDDDQGKKTKTAA